jgi:hypothetical protein
MSKVMRSSFVSRLLVKCAQLLAWTRKLDCDASLVCSPFKSTLYVNLKGAQATVREEVRGFVHPISHSGIVVPSLARWDPVCS